MIGIAGLGFVGSTLSKALDLAGVEHVGYDPFKGANDIEPLASCITIFIVVGTPQVEDDLEIASVYGVLEDLAEICEDDTLFAIKSTVPPGTNDLLAEMYPQFRFASVPEFLVQDDALNTFLNPDRIVIGARERRTSSELTRLMADVTKQGHIVVTTPTEAELIKLASNVLLATKVAVANALSDVCQEHGVNWNNGIKTAVGMDGRIGSSHLGVTRERGFGGACFPKDLRGMIAAAERAPGCGDAADLLRAVEQYNRVIRGELPGLSTNARAAKAFDLVRQGQEQQARELWERPRWGRR